MRTIKFRAELAVTGGLIYFYLKDIKGRHSVNLLELSGGAVIIESTIQQFTGLLDKNGKEIFEGDIVQLSINGEVPRHQGTVQYLAPKFFVMDRSDSGLLLTDKYEVIGNVYDNPELLK